MRAKDEFKESAMRIYFQMDSVEKEGGGGREGGGIKKFSKV